MQKPFKFSALIVFCCTLFFSCSNESKTDTAQLVDTLGKAVDSVQVIATDPEQIAEEQKQALLKSSNATMRDVGDWVKQFEVVSRNIINNNEDGTKSPEESREVINTVFKNGIHFNETHVFEIHEYELFIPLLNAKEAKKVVERLCKNMGTCMGPDEVDVKYTETKDGVKVEWGGGC
jgi:hypothetical protein